MCFGDKVSQDTKKINKQLKKRRREMDNEVRLLLLGTGGSGKSTFAKQMKIIFSSGFKREELEEFKRILHNNIISSIRMLVQQAATWELELDKMNETHASFVMDSNTLKGDVTPEMVPHIKALWKDPAIQKVFSRSNQFSLPSSCKYCMDNLENISKPDYLPDVNDILNARQKTTGVIETIFLIDDIVFTMVDVGGQKNERRKWIHCFEGVSSVIYCVGLSDYDCVMVEDSTTNMMIDSFENWTEVSNNKWFKDIPIMLFLNKHDLFQEKATIANLKDCFPEYDGALNPEHALEFIKKKYMSVVKDLKQRRIYTHVTVAINTEQVKLVFGVVKNNILNSALRKTGLLTEI
eukprot:TRINITY_DN11855_c0_g1_i1.p1 TRINITY_DN11855_c0_g1~~TRINITY_DN11855_c0_g1_i1.p1  ORF type:complete len:350 (-),score=60.14 TRINITY_DN11855_c0_g1_i1:52-1101(-)